jgi:hypothetical protein
MNAPSSGGERFVRTADIRAAVKGRETVVLDYLGIPWRAGRPHISCPYPTHADRDPSWRVDPKTGRIFCTCITRADDVFGAVMKIKAVSFDDAKIIVVDAIGRSDLIKTKGGGTGQRQDAATLLDPPADNRDNGLPLLYLAARLGIDPIQVPVPTTQVVGIKSLAYFDSPVKNGKVAAPVLVARRPCAVFATVAPDGRRHAMRLYLEANGAGKADLGQDAAGKERDSKKSAWRDPQGPSIAGCCVTWGDPGSPRVLLHEGIETAAAVAFSFADETARRELGVVSAISADGIAAFNPWPGTSEIVVGADRDEGKPGPGFKRGERAARKLALRLAQAAPEDGPQISVLLALPGEPGTKTDFLDLFLAQGSGGVRACIAAAVPIEPTRQEIERFERETAQENEIARVVDAYPIPPLVMLRLKYQATQWGEIWLHKLVIKKEKATGAKIEIWLPICSPITLAARLRLLDEDEVYGLRVQLADMDGTGRPVDFHRAELARLAASEIRSRLMAAGLRVANGGELTIVEILKEARPATSLDTASATGWHQRRFITLDGEEIA